MNIWERGRAITWVVLLFLGGPLDRTAIADVADLRVTDLTLLSSQRVTRVEFDYRYRVNVENAGPAMENVVATVRSLTSATQIIDGEVVLGSVPADSQSISDDTITIRQNRTYPFSRSNLAWSFQGSETPPQNAVPVAVAGPDLSAKVGDVVSLDGTGSTDLDGDALSYAWTLVSRPTGSASALSDPLTAQPTILIDRAGTYALSLTVSDALSSSVPDEVRISTVNTAPIADAGPDQTAPLASTVQLDGSGSSDPDLDPFTFAWVLTAKPLASTAELSGGATEAPSLTLDAPGTYIAQLTVSDGALTSAPDLVTINTENSRPVANAGPDQAGYVGDAIVLDASASSDVDGDDLSYEWSLLSQPSDSTVTLDGADTASATLLPDAPGLYVVQLIVDDGALQSVPDTATLTIDVVPPPTDADGDGLTDEEERALGTDPNIADSDGDGLNDGDEVALETNPLSSDTDGDNLSDGEEVGSYRTSPLVADTDGDTFLDGEEVAAGSNPTTVQSTPVGALPPDPATVAPALDPMVETTLAAATRFLYTGPNPIQRDVNLDAMAPARLSVVVGKVTRVDGTPLAGVRVSAIGRPEWGYTLTRTDGAFDLAATAGLQFTLRFEREGFFSAQRAVNPPAKEFDELDVIALVAADSAVTTIEAASADTQVARANRVSDGDGERQATLAFPPGTSAVMELPDGTTQTLQQLSVRATEYTVGPGGLSAMPAELPASVAYTYAVELSVDEALEAEARNVRFNRPVPFYVENFLGFRIGSAVPVASYDRERGQWVPEANGRVIRIVAESGGLAEVDVDGDGAADAGDELAALDISEEERRQLATLYAAPTALWRVMVSHFSPYDLNWPNQLRDPPPRDTNKPRRKNEDEYTIECGSVIENENQTLGQVARVTGTPFSLNYRSDRVPGRTENYTLDLVLAEQADPSLQRVRVEVVIAGKVYDDEVVPAPGAGRLDYRFVWDGRDKYGRVVQGEQAARVTLEYEYLSVYQEPSDTEASFGDAGAATTDVSVRTETTFARVELRETLGTYFTDRVGIGAWTLSPQHHYGVQSLVLHQGDGHRRRAQTISAVIERATNAEIFASYVVPRAFGQDGSIYVPLTDAHLVVRIHPDGAETIVAGTGEADFKGDGGPATEATLRYPDDVAVTGDGSVYISDSGNNRIRRVRPDGIIETVAGGGTAVAPAWEGIAATEAQLVRPQTLGLGPDGSIYAKVAYGPDIPEPDFGEPSSLIVRIAPDGTLRTVAGRGYGGTVLPGSSRSLTDPNVRAKDIAWAVSDFAVALDGSVHVAEYTSRFEGSCSTNPDTGQTQCNGIYDFYDFVSRITPDGRVQPVAGRGWDRVNSTSELLEDGDVATDAKLPIGGARGVAAGRDGSVYIAGGSKVRKVGPDRRITTIAGGQWTGTWAGDGEPALLASIDAQRIGVGLDGSVYIAGDWVDDLSEGAVRRIAPAAAGFLQNEIVIPSSDGDQLFVFDLEGRHQRTLNALTGAAVLQFEYDALGRLVAIEDADQNRTTIERDGAGEAVAIVSPYGQRTTLEYGAVGESRYLTALIDPAGHRQTYAYGTGGLLSGATDALGLASTYEYDAHGRLAREVDSRGATLALERTDASDGTKSFSVRAEDAAGFAATYRMSYPPDGNRVREVVYPDETSLVAVTTPAGTTSIVSPSGSTSETTPLADPRFGLQGTPLQRQRWEFPSLGSYEVSMEREVDLGDPSDPLSLRVLTDRFTSNGDTVTTQYSRIDNEMVTTSAADRVIVRSLDERGRTIEERLGTTGQHEPVRFGYDVRGRLATIERGSVGNERSVAYEYDATGFLNRVTLASGRAITFERDALGQLLRQILPDGAAIRYSYDANGRLLSLSPPSGTTHRFVYDAGGRVARYEPPTIAGVTAGPTIYGRDSRGALTSVQRPDGTTVLFGYDDAGRLTSKTFPGGRIDYAFDSVTGALSGIDTLAGQQVRIQRVGPLLTGEVWEGPVAGSVERTYDARLNLAGLRVQGEDVAFDYDADELVVSAGELEIVRDDIGAISSTGLLNVQDQRTFDPFGALSVYYATHGSDVLYSFELGYDVDGRIVRLAESSDTGASIVEEFEYDPRDRLVLVRRDGAVVMQVTYDSNGNRSFFSAAGQSVSPIHDAQDRLLQWGAVRYDYNPNGERIRATDQSSGAITEYAYDALGNLVRVTLPSGSVVEYIVDGANRRVAKKVDGVIVQRFLYQNALAAVAELDASGNLVRRFVYGTRPNVPDYMTTASGVYRILVDPVGSPRAVVDAATGEVVQRIEYDRFGRVASDSNPGFQPFGFAGGLYDRDTGLVRFGSRDYDPAIGRFLSKDPALFEGQDNNLYAYAQNDPVNQIDPDGRQALGPTELGQFLRGEIGVNELEGWMPATGADSGVVDLGDGNSVQGRRGADGLDYYSQCVNGSCEETVYDSRLRDDYQTSGSVAVDTSCQVRGGGNCRSNAEQNALSEDAIADFDPAAEQPPAVPPSEYVPDLVPIPLPPPASTLGRKCAVNIWRDSAGNVLSVVPVPP